MSSRWRMIWASVALATLLSACSPTDFAETPFSRQASDAASSLSAAAMTIQHLHEGKLDRHYAAASLPIYRTMVEKIAPTLSSQRGAPDEATLRPVLNALETAEPALDDPCLDDACDWQGQVEALREAQRQLLEAIE